MLAIAATTKAFLVGLLVAFFIEIVFTWGEEPSVFPPLTSPWVVGLVALIAVRFGLRTFRRFSTAAETPPWRMRLSVWVGAALVLAGWVYHSGSQNEQTFLAAMSASDGNSAYYLDEGKQACDWLAHKHWGPPKGHDAFNKRIPMGKSARAPRLIESTGKLYTAYMKTDLAPRNGYIVINAWYKLCPFQQWVHRPVADAD